MVSGKDGETVQISHIWHARGSSRYVLSVPLVLLPLWCTEQSVQLPAFSSLLPPVPV